MKANDGGTAYRLGTEKIPAEISANENSIPVASLYSHPVSESPMLEAELAATHVLRGYVNSMYGAEMAFDSSLYWNEVPVTVTDGTLRIAIASETSQNDCWCCFDNFTLYYNGEGEKAVDGITSETATQAVYTPTGIRVAEKAADLPAGIYIVGGRKIVIK